MTPDTDNYTVAGTPRRKRNPLIQLPVTQAMAVRVVGTPEWHEAQQVKQANATRSHIQALEREIIERKAEERERQRTGARTQSEILDGVAERDPMPQMPRQLKARGPKQDGTGGEVPVHRQPKTPKQRPRRTATRV